MAAVPVIIRVVSDDAIPVPIDGVEVRAYTAPGDVFVSQGTTGVPTPGSGEAELTLDGDGVGISYFVRFFKQGVSFDASPYDLTVVDPPPPPNELEVSAHVGETALVVKCVVQDDQSVPQPVEGFRLRVYDDSDTYLTEDETDSAGEVFFTLPGAPDPGQTYLVRLFKTGWSVPLGSTQQVQVLDPLVPPATNIFDFIAHEFVAEESDDPEMCRITGYLVDTAKHPMRGVSLTFFQVPTFGVQVGHHFPGNPSVIGEHVLAGEERVVPDSSGWVDFKLPRNSYFTLHITGLEVPSDDGIYENLYVPDVLGLELSDLLFPYVTEVAFSSTVLAMTVGDAEPITYTIDLSNFQDLSLVCTTPLVEFSSDDEDVATVELVNGDDGPELQVTAIAAGTANIIVARTGEEAPRRPDLPAITNTPIAVTVT